MTLLLTILAPAFGQEQMCDAIYTVSDLRGAIREAAGLVEAGRGDRASDVLGRTRDVLHCMNELVPTEDLVAFAETRAIASFLVQEADDAVRWGRLVEVLEPEHTWPETAGGVQMLLEDADDVRMSTADGKGFLVEKGGSVFLDGKFLPEPSAWAGMPHLVQVFNGKGHLLKGHWQDGGAFPEELLGPAGALSEPRYFDAATSTITPRGKPPSDLPKRDPIPKLVLVGGGLVVVSGALYTLAGISHARFACDVREKDTCPTTSEELTSLRTRTNLLVLGAGVTFASGVGLGVTGVLTDAPGLRVSGRF
ncbi:MAG: hypothetical protein H6736_13480 [Alphaproteobacteria bacterium]|nr:hypothetical protein [Alphaproteobacteria bacterium]MCB9692816.1 hypothetical protein [Alphaproteobacteria bacterium]